MCGIAYVKRLDGKKAQKMIRKRYDDQKSRGTQGFGYVSIDDGYVVDAKKATTEKVIFDEIEKQSANEMIFHHRYPTSTPNFTSCAHPIYVKHPSLKYVYYVVHNGVIYNDTPLRDQHIKEGYKYTTEIHDQVVDAEGNIIKSSVQWNDTEALAIELAKDLDGDMKGLAHIRGSIAFIALQCDYETGKAVNLFFGRNYGSPLNLNVTDEFITLTSEGKGKVVEAHMLHRLDYSDTLIYTRPYKVGEAEYKSSYYEHDDYEHGTGRTVTKYTPQGDKIGYKVQDTPVNEDEEEQDTYLDLLDEYEQIKKFLTDETLGENERLEWEIELENVTRQMDEMSARFYKKQQQDEIDEYIASYNDPANDPKLALPEGY